MSYTPSPTRAKTATNFSGLVDDGNRNALTGALGNQMQTQDATASPVVSPVTVNTTTTLTVPANAASVLIVSVTNAVQVSEDSTQSAYFSLPAGIVQEFDCARQKFVYLKTSGSTVVSFLFRTI